MKIQRNVSRILTFLLDLAELYVPMWSFILLFVLFVVNVFFRYVINSPLTWPHELISLSFLWTAIMSATFVRRVGGHVSFTLVYESLTERRQCYARIFSNVLIAAAFVIAIPATIDWVSFMNFKGTPILGISFSIVYFPIIPFLILIAGHSIYDTYIDVRKLISGKFGSAGAQSAGAQSEGEKP